nr:MAG TPA: hypothetical protein [Caudoviricetes sp.]
MKKIPQSSIRLRYFCCNSFPFVLLYIQGFRGNNG